MVNLQLVGYIKQNVSQGYGLSQLKDFLVTHGYNPYEVIEAVKYVSQEMPQVNHVDTNQPVLPTEVAPDNQVPVSNPLPPKEPIPSTVPLQPEPIRPPMPTNEKATILQDGIKPIPLKKIPPRLKQQQVPITERENNNPLPPKEPIPRVLPLQQEPIRPMPTNVQMQNDVNPIKPIPLKPKPIIKPWPEITEARMIEENHGLNPNFIGVDNRKMPMKEKIGGKDGFEDKEQSKDGKPDTDLDDAKSLNKEAVGIERRNPIIISLLFIITVGIYSLFWLISTTKELRDNSDSAPSPWLLLLMLVPGVNIVVLLVYYWKYAQGLNELTGVSVGSLFALFILLFPVGMILAQIELNKKSEKTQMEARKMDMEIESIK